MQEIQKGNTGWDKKQSSKQNTNEPIQWVEVHKMFNSNWWTVRSKDLMDYTLHKGGNRDNVPILGGTGGNAKER